MTTLLNRIVEQSALKSPAATAVRCDGTTLSYEQLARRVNGLARVLVETGVRRGDRVAVWLGKGTRVPVGFYGTFAAGGVLVPIDPKSPVDQVAGILRATGATHLVTEPQRRDGVLRALAASSGLTHIIGLDQDDGAAGSLHAMDRRRRGRRRSGAGRRDCRRRCCLHPPHLRLDRPAQADPAYALERDQLRRLGSRRIRPDRQRSDHQSLVASHLLCNVRFLRRRPRRRRHRDPDAGNDADAGEPVGASRAGAGDGVVLGPCRARPAVAPRRSRVARPASAALGALCRRDVSDQAPAAHPAAAPVGAVQPRLWLDRGQRLHLLPSARGRCSRRRASDRACLHDRRDARCRRRDARGARRRDRRPVRPRLDRHVGLLERRGTQPSGPRATRGRRR